MCLEVPPFSSAVGAGWVRIVGSTAHQGVELAWAIPLPWDRSLQQSSHPPLPRPAPGPVIRVCLAGGLWGEAAVAWGSLPPEVCEVYTECCLVTRLRLVLLGQGHPPPAPLPSLTGNWNLLGCPQARE